MEKLCLVYLALKRVNWWNIKAEKVWAVWLHHGGRVMGLSERLRVPLGGSGVTR